MILIPLHHQDQKSLSVTGHLRWRVMLVEVPCEIRAVKFGILIFFDQVLFLRSKGITIIFANNH